MFSHRRGGFARNEVSHQIAILRRGRHPAFSNKITPAAAAMARRLQNGEDVEIPSSPESEAPAAAASQAVTPPRPAVAHPAVPNAPPRGRAVDSTAQRRYERSPSPEWVARRPRLDVAPQAAPAPRPAAPPVVREIILPPQEHTDDEIASTRIRVIAVPVAAATQDSSSSDISDSDLDTAPRRGVATSTRGAAMVDFILDNAGRMGVTITHELTGRLHATLDSPNQEDVELILAISNLISPSAAVYVARNMLRNNSIANLLSESVQLEEDRQRREETLPECPICMDHHDTLYKTCYTCSHEVCWNCMCETIFNALGSNGNTVRCPCCLPSASSDDVVAFTFPEAQCIPVSAFGLIDPYFFLQALKAVGSTTRTAKQTLACDRFIRSGQMEPFISTDMSDKPPAKCPFCNAWAVGRVGGDLVARCPNASCAALFCTGCKGVAHVGHTCDEAMGVARAKSDAKSEEYMRKVSKQCPRCQTPITHFRDHGCHHITCGHCRAEFCYVCLRPYGGERCGCPVFCGDRCNCLACDECRRDKPCRTCGTGCGVCRGTAAPGVY